MHNDKQDLTDLLEKQQNGTITPEEAKLLQEWYEQLHMADPEVWDFEGQEAFVREDLYSGIQTRIRRRRTVWIYRSLRWTAAAAVLILVSVWLFRWNRPSRMAGAKDFVWTVIGNDSLIPKKVTLPDGSVAWLNSGSHLRFNGQFGEDNRLLQADGELLLDIQPGKSHPLQVITRNITTTVLGTVFNIEAYSNEKELKISLLSGKVLVKDSSGETQLLKPGQTAISSGPGGLAVSSRDNAGAGGWVRGGLSFEEALLSDALRRMERKYGIQFDYTSALLTDQRITASIAEGGDWEATLKSILFIYNIQFKKVKQVIHLYR